MERWLTYLKERFPLPVYALLVAGFTTSGVVLGSGASDGALRIPPLLLGFLGLLLFFALLRLMDEYKDYEKDVIAHPGRPLPRGLLRREEVRTGILALWLAMLGFSALALLAGGTLAGAAYLLISLYLWLMYQEFYIGEKLGQSPLLYAVSHQVIIFPICAFPAFLAGGQEFGADVSQVAYYGLSVLGAFFSYEVGRKLDPKAHPVLKTYLAEYGPGGVIAILAVATAVAAFGSLGLGLAPLLAPAQGLVLAGAALIWVRPAAYKISEGLITLSLVLHIWGPVIQKATGWPV